jgi:hypothetical protein
MLGDNGLQSPPPESTGSGITIPPLNGAIGHVRQKPSRVGLGDRQYSYEITTGPSVHGILRSNPLSPPLHHRQYSEGGASGEKSPPAVLNAGRNASVGSLEISQSLNPANGMEETGLSFSAGRRRHAHGRSHGHSHHHHPSHAGPAPPKPASMMSITLFDVN